MKVGSKLYITVSTQWPLTLNLPDLKDTVRPVQIKTNSPEFHFRFMNSIIQPSRVGSLQNAVPKYHSKGHEQVIYNLFW